MSEHDDDPTPPDAPASQTAIDAARAREDERIRQLILARRNRFMAAALAGAGVALNGCWDSGSDGGGGASGAAGAAGESGAGGVSGASGASGLGGVGGPSVCLSIDPCAESPQVPPCVCLEPPFFEDAGVDGEDGGIAPNVCLSFE